jgi:hypothetical protein
LTIPESEKPPIAPRACAKKGLCLGGNLGHLLPHTIPALFCISGKDGGVGQRHSAVVGRDRVNQGQVLQEALPFSHAGRRRGANLSWRPGLYHHGLGVAGAVQEDGFGSDRQVRLTQCRKRTVLASGTVAPVIDGELEGQVAQRASGPVEQIVAASSNARDLPLPPVATIGAAPAVQVGEQRAEGFCSFPLSGGTHQDVLHQLGIGRQSAQVDGAASHLFYVFHLFGGDAHGPHDLFLGPIVIQAPEDLVQRFIVDTQG